MPTTSERPSRKAMLRTLSVEVAAPLVVFYGLRALGADQVVALLIAAILPAARTVYRAVTARRLDGIAVFMLGALVLTVVMSTITGEPRVLLIRNAWGTAALGLWILGTLFVRKPFLFTGARLVFDDAQQLEWDENWQRHPAFRHVLWVCTAVWGAVFLGDAALRVLLAMTLPIDVVPVLDDVLLVVTLVVLVVFQRWYGRPYLRRHGLRLRGVHLTADEPAR